MYRLQHLHCCGTCSVCFFGPVLKQSKVLMDKVFADKAKLEMQLLARPIVLDLEHNRNLFIFSILFSCVGSCVSSCVMDCSLCI